MAIFFFTADPDKNFSILLISHSFQLAGGKGRLEEKSCDTYEEFAGQKFLEPEKNTKRLHSKRCGSLVFLFCVTGGGRDKHTRVSLNVMLNIWLELFPCDSF